jgi:hypothetical protein
VKVYYRLFARVAILLVTYVCIALLLGRGRLSHAFLMAGLFGVVALALGMEAVRDVSTPLRRIADSVQRALEGDFSATNIEVKRSDEIGFLSSVTAGTLRYLARQHAVIEMVVSVARGETLARDPDILVARLRAVAQTHLGVEDLAVGFAPVGAAPPLGGAPRLELIPAGDARAAGLRSWLGAAEGAAWTALAPLTASSSGDVLAVAAVRLRAGRELSDEIRRFLEALLGALAFDLERAAVRAAAGRSAIDAAEREARARVDAAAAAEPPSLAGYELAAFHRAGAEPATDVVQYLEAPGRLFVLVGDTLGPGAIATLAKASLLGALAALGTPPAELGPAELLELANRALFRAGGGALTAALFVAAFEPGSGSVRCASAGGTRPLLARARRAEEIGVRGPLLGQRADARFDVVTLALEPGDTLFMDSDGLDGQRALAIQVLEAGGSAAARRDAIARGLGAAATDDLSFVIARRGG